MATALVGGAFLSASLQVLFDRLASRSFSDFILRRRTEERLLIKNLTTTILTLEAILEDPARRRTPSPAVKEWLNELDDAVNDARNLLDEIATEGSGSKSWSRSRSKFVREILERLEHMSTQKDVIDWKAPPDVSATTSIPVDESSICGRGDDKNAVVSLLLSGYETAEDPTRISAIVGVPGIGKTTLAKLVYNDNRVGGHFDLKVWLCVSTGLNIYTVAKTVIEAVSESACNTDDLNLLQLRLKEETIGKRLLIVLDDVYNIKDRAEWEVIRSSFSFCRHGSAVIVTTRSEDVARTICALPIYHLNPLPYEHCWVLFSSHAFIGGSSLADPGLEAVAREIVNKCRGIPLAIKTLGILLRTKPDREEWDRILNNEIWDSSGDMNTVLLRIKDGMAKRSRAIAPTTRPAAPRQNCRQMRNIRSKQERFPIYCVIWLVVLGIISASVFEAAKRVHLTKQKEELRRMCDNRAKVLQDQFESHVNNTNNLAVFITQLHRLDRLLDKKQSEEFLKNYMLATVHMHPFLEAVVFEGYLIGNKYDSVMARGSTEVDSHALSLYPPKRGIAEAMATGKTTVSRPFKRFDSRQVHFAMAYPIYKASLSVNTTVNQRCDAVVGYMGTVFRFDSFAEHVLGQLDGRDTISVSVFDATESPDCLLLYRSGDHKSSQSLLHESKLKLGDPCRRYKITCRYRQKAPLSWIGITLTSLTVVIGLLLGCVVLGAAVHSLKIQELEAQAKAVNAANSQFLSAASREIRKPAYSIHETLGLVLRMELSSPGRDSVRVAQQGCERLIALISEVLDPDNSTFQIQQGHLPIEIQSPQEHNMNMAA